MQVIMKAALISGRDRAKMRLQLWNRPCADLKTLRSILCPRLANRLVRISLRKRRTGLWRQHLNLTMRMSAAATIAGNPMKEGYYLGGEFACSDECALALYHGDKAQMDET